MRTREYGQFCGLARAVEVLGQRWTMLMLRDLFVGPQRYSDLLVGLPGIPTNVLASRLKELEADGLVVREAAPEPTGRWCTGLLRGPRSSGPRWTPWRAGGLPGCGSDAKARSSPMPRWWVPCASPAKAARRRARRPVIYEVRVGSAVAHATVAGGEISVAPGGIPRPTWS